LLWSSDFSWTLSQKTFEDLKKLYVDSVLKEMSSSLNSPKNVKLLSDDFSGVFMS